MTDNKVARYITRVHIENFQDHQDTEIVLKPGINLIVGSSDAGKSAILRAINWVFHNQPRSTSFIRFGSDEARVSISFSDGTEVCRIKGKQRNAIIIEKTDGTNLVFEKIGHELPPEAIEILGNPPIDERHGPISYSEQMSPYFLVSLTPTEMPRSISELTGINDFEEAAQILGKKSRQANDQMKEGQKRLDRYAQDLISYVDLDERIDNLATLDEKANKVERIIVRINEVATLSDKYETVMVTGRRTSKQYKRAKAIAACGEKLPQVQEVAEIINDVSALYQNYLDIEKNEDNFKLKILKAWSITSPSIVKKVEKAKKATVIIDDVSTLIAKYKNIEDTAQSISSEYEKWNEKIANMEIEYNQIAKEMKEQGLWCDICDRPLAVDQCSKEG